MKKVPTADCKNFHRTQSARKKSIMQGKIRIARGRGREKERRCTTAIEVSDLSLLSLYLSSHSVVFGFKVCAIARFHKLRAESLSLPFSFSPRGPPSGRDGVRAKEKYSHSRRRERGREGESERADIARVR